MLEKRSTAALFPPRIWQASITAALDGRVSLNARQHLSSFLIRKLDLLPLFLAFVLGLSLAAVDFSLFAFCFHASISNRLCGLGLLFVFDKSRKIVGRLGCLCNLGFLRSCGFAEDGAEDAT